MLIATRINELASGKNVSRIAVEKFLSSLGDMSYQEAVADCEYRWNHETTAAIRIGILEHNFGKKAES